MRIYPSFQASKESALLIGLLKSFGRKESFSLLFHIRDISIHSFYGGGGFCEDQSPDSKWENVYRSQIWVQTSFEAILPLKNPTW